MKRELARLEGRDHLLAWGLGLATFLLILSGSDSVGFTRDEGYYFKAARDYLGWFDLLFTEPSRALSQAGIDAHWSYNPEHPVVMKVLFGFSERVFSHWLGWMDGPSAMRLPGMAAAALSIALVYILGRQVFSQSVGLLAALLLLAQPRFLYHGHLACFDSAITTLWLAVVVAYLNRGDSLRGHLRLGLVFGLAIATKHNALFLPIVFGLHWIFCQRDRFRLEGNQLRLPPIPWWVVAMGILGPLVFLAHWPYLWPAPVERIGFYVGFHLHHEHYPVRYFGTGLWEPPFPRHFPFAMWALTIPLATFVAGCAGLFSQTKEGLGALWHGRWDRQEIPALLLLNTLIPVLLIAGPSVPVFGGTKHWMNALPFFTVIAAAWAWPQLERLARHRPTQSWALAALLVLPGFVTTLRHHPHGIGSYNELAGGLRGAANLGMERQFWGGASRQLLDHINAEAKRGASLFLDRTNREAFNAYKEEGLIREDLRFSRGLRGADWLVNFHQPDSDWVLSAIREQKFKPVAAVEVEGVPMASLHKRSR